MLDILAVVRGKLLIHDLPELLRIQKFLDDHFPLLLYLADIKLQLLLQLLGLSLPCLFELIHLFLKLSQARIKGLLSSLSRSQLGLQPPLLHLQPVDVPDLG